MSAGFTNGNFAHITINDQKVTVDKNVSGHFRGLHIVIINKSNGKVKIAKVFDTYKSSQELDAFIDNTILRNGNIVVIACKDDCVTSLSENAKQWLTDMGSDEIEELEYR